MKRLRSLSEESESEVEDRPEAKAVQAVQAAEQQAEQQAESEDEEAGAIVPTWGRKRTTKAKVRNFTLVRNEAEVQQAGFVYRKIWVADIPLLRSGDGLHLLQVLGLNEFLLQPIPSLVKEHCDEFIGSYDGASRRAVVKGVDIVLDAASVSEAVKLPLGRMDLREAQVPRSVHTAEQKSALAEMLIDVTEKKNRGYDLGQLIYEGQDAEVVACIASALMTKLECTRECFHYVSPEILLALDMAIRGVEVQWAGYLAELISRSVIKSSVWRKGVQTGFPFGEWLSVIIRIQLNKHKRRQRKKKKLNPQLSVEQSVEGPSQALVCFEARDSTDQDCEIQQLRQNISTLRTEIKKLNSEKEQSDQRLSDAAKTTVAKYQERWSQKLQTVRADHAQEVAKLSAIAKAEQDKYQERWSQKLQTVRAEEVAKFSAIAKAEQDKNGKFSASLEAEQDKNRKFSARLEAEQGKNRKLSASLEAEQGKNRKFSASFEAEQDKNRELSAILEAEQDKNRELSASLEAEQGEVANLKSGNQMLLKKWKEGISSREAAEGWIEKLKATNKAAAHEGGKLRREMATLRAQNEELSHTCHSLKTENEQLKAENAKDNESLKAGIEQLKGQAERSRTEVEQLKGQAERSRAEVEQLKGQAERSRAEVGQLKGQAERSRTEVGQFKGQAERSRAEVEQLKGQAERSRAEVGQLKGQAERSRAEVEQLKGQAERSRTEVEQFKGQAERSRAEVEQFKGQAERSRTEVEQFKGQAERSRAEVGQLKGQAKRSRAEAEELKGQAERSRAEVEELKGRAKRELSKVKGENDVRMAKMREQHGREIEKVKAQKDDQVAKLKENESLLDHSRRVIAELRLENGKLSKEMIGTRKLHDEITRLKAEVLSSKTECEAAMSASTHERRLRESLEQQVAKLELLEHQVMELKSDKVKLEISERLMAANQEQLELQVSRLAADKKESVERFDELSAKYIELWKSRRGLQKGFLEAQHFWTEGLHPDN